MRTVKRDGAGTGQKPPISSPQRGNNELNFKLQDLNAGLVLKQ